MDQDKLVILFDGNCNLCNSTVQFVIDRDTKDQFRFCALQSKTGQEILKQHGLPEDYTDSFIISYKNKIYYKSSAALLMFKHLNGLWPLLYAFVIVPPFIRHAVYSFVARNRYKWFGKSEYCRVMTPDVKHKFI